MNFRFNNEVSIAVEEVALQGDLIIPREAKAIIIFSHGSGSSRLSPRNRMVAQQLQEKGFGTLLLDLLTPVEDEQYANRFDIHLLTRRLTGATRWMSAFAEARNCSIGYFGASTGAASALSAAAGLREVNAIVSRGGRPDLAMDALEKVTAPTLLIVGGLDHEVLELNTQAYNRLTCEKKLEIIPGASHLFEEYGTLDTVAEMAGRWFSRHLLAEAYP
ncbi:dienelactone hydrolase family protein [Flavitalea sp. BT771]|uniref:dienelactone hydrolase family protein n=1 Tax=Flavitalea sp. BT771 TaxID=3063329 RepID=UPI0026E47D0B|nr:dienelactone hydrolase family protein [Flavitalea sp. BT771]MDO6430345.1 dienelactone hydrolase family protein [Flavitalea sp. BT771]MDV6219515.1 dienelactone hydrolase family protein [Flavitalea sp. BT771]